jgi:sRNA-binding regulator protein Hfq
MSVEHESRLGLLELATQKFPELSAGEKKLFVAVASGKVADCSSKAEEENDPAQAAEWRDDRVISADRIAWLCTDPQAGSYVTRQGISVRGARVDGELELAFATIPFPLYFERSALPEGIDLQYAQLRALNLCGTHTGPISADNLCVDAVVFLRDGFRAQGEVRLLGARIGGTLSCIGGQFINKEAQALSADRLKVEGNVHFENGFRAQGEVRLSGARIGGQFSCVRGHFLNEGGTALNADGAIVEGPVFLRNGFKAEGEVRLIGAKVGGQLSCIDGQFANEGGIALNGDGMTVNGNVFLTTQFRAEGEVRLIGARIGGNLECQGGHFLNSSGYALNADGLLVEGALLIRKVPDVDGLVSLVGATIKGYLVWAELLSARAATLDLRSAQVRTLLDDSGSWPSAGRLLLDGLVYDEVHENSPTDARSRIEWLRRQPEEPFRPQPYEQLAAVLHKSGHEEHAKRILIAKNQDRARLTKLTRTEWWWYSVFGPLIGYGYRPWRALRLILLFLILGCIFFEVGFRTDVIAPAEVSAYVTHDPGETRTLSRDYPRFNSFVYSVDTFVPLVDLRQAEYWLPNANRGPEMLTSRWFKVCGGGLLYVYLVLHIGFGWVLTTLLVIGLTGLVRT